MRFAILGNSGSGKSTLAASLSARHSLPVLDLDTIAWAPGEVGVPRDPAEAAADVRSFCQRNESFVVEGCYEQLIAAALELDPELIFLDVSVEICEQHCRSRPHEPHKYASIEAQNEKLPFLLGWVRDYYTRSGPMSHVEHARLFESYSGPKTRHGAPVEDPSRGWDAVAAAFVARRSPVIGVAAVRKWAAGIPYGASILDLGCGHGMPISAALAQDGFDIHGIDASPSMVREFRSNLPEARVQCEPVERSTFFGRRFDAVIAIGLVFLLPGKAQLQLISRVSGHLLPGGRFLFTAPTQEVEWMDILTGRPSRSLGRTTYVAVLSDAGLRLTEEFTDEGDNHYYSVLKS